VSPESKPIGKAKRKILLHFRLPANVKNTEKAIKCLGGRQKIYQIAKQLDKSKKLIDKEYQANKQEKIPLKRF
jgi:hypothetical protein